MSGRAAAREDLPKDPEDIETRLRSQREALSTSVDELAARVDPRVQARLAGRELRGRAEGAVASLRERAADAADRAREAVDDARAGETGALARVIALAGGALAAGVLLRRLLRH